MNRCDQARRLFGPYWDDEVTQAEREWLESHLAGCSECRPQYEQFARTLETVGSLPRTDVAADLAERALVAARRATAVPDRVAGTPAFAGRPDRPMWIQVTATAALLLVGLSALLPWLGTPAVQRVFAHRETQVPEPRLVATAAQVPGQARPEATLVDSLLNHQEDVEFILDPVVLHRGRAQAPSRLPKGVQGEQAVISF
jgi:anti-sigma factor RsiW